MKENFAEQSEPPGWWSRNGIVGNMEKVAKEFCKERKLQAMRTLIMGSKVEPEWDCGQHGESREGVLQGAQAAGDANLDHGLEGGAGMGLWATWRKSRRSSARSASCRRCEP